MKNTAIGIAMASILGFTACAPLTADQATVVGVAGGAAGGLLLAELLDADDNWRLIAALGGAAAGTLIAQNARTNQCAYADGRGGYVTRAC